jgi:hypothetical protein
VGVVIKHRKLARQVGVFTEHPSENLMASFNFTSVVLDEGTTFTFSSWICIANGSGGFNSHLANSREPEASSLTPSSDLDKFIDKLDDLLLPIWPYRSKRCSFSTRSPLVTHEIYSGRIQTDLKTPHDLRTWEPPLVGRPP